MLSLYFLAYLLGILLASSVNVYYSILRGARSSPFADVHKPHEQAGIALGVRR